jgi:3-oxoacyl-[acyl-carrier protein] reductase
VKRLENKTAVITGASSGIGAAIAQRFADEGAEVVVNYRSSLDKAGKVAAAIRAAGGIAHIMQADVSDAAAVKTFVRQVHEKLGRIDIWVNNAGADILTGSLARLDDHAKLESLLDVDLCGTMTCCWEVAPLMQQQPQGGVILNMGWSQALVGMAGRNPELFAAVKAGVIGYSKCLAKNLAPAVRVNVLAPGWIETAFAHEYMPDDYRQNVLEGIPLERMGHPGDIAAAAVFLAAEDSAYITGHVLNVDGGEG